MSYDFEIMKINDLLVFITSVLSNVG